MPAAVGTSRVVIVMYSLAGFSGALSHAAVDFGLIATLGGCAVLGSFVGARLAHRIDPASLRRSFAGFILLMALFILVREGRALAESLASAVPGTLPQLGFALLVLGMGIVAGRASRPGRGGPGVECSYQEGAGI